MRFDTLNDFSEVSGIGVHVIGEDGVELFSTPCYDKTRPALDSLADAFGVREKTCTVMLKSCALSAQYGGLYTFLCPLGLTYISSPVAREGEPNRFALVGPMILSSREDYLDFEVLPQVDKADFVKIKALIEDIPVVDASFISPLSEQFFVNAVFLSGGRTSQAASEGGRVSQTVSGDVERAVGTGSNSPNQPSVLDQYRVQGYMFRDPGEAREQLQLTKTLREHGDEEAQVLLDEIYEQVLFRPHNNIDYIKGNITEYVLKLYRSAIYDGTDVKTVMQLKNRAMLEIDELEDIDEAIVWLNALNEQFSIHVARDPHSKHAETIRASLAYLNDHYAERVTLEDVAAHVSFSASYLSRLFKDETGQSFKTCLNRVRLEKSKELMGNSDLSIADVGYAVGFADQSYFARVFKQYENVSPYQYRLSLESDGRSCGRA